MTNLNPEQFGSGVSLDRERPIPGMAFNPESHYRMLGEGGWADFQHAQIIRPKPGSRYADAYFSKGHAFDRYRSRAGAFDYVAEVHDTSAMRPAENGYPVAARPLGPGDVTVHRIDNSTGKVDVVHTPRKS